MSIASRIGRGVVLTAAFLSPNRTEAQHPIYLPTQPLPAQQFQPIQQPPQTIQPLKIYIGDYERTKVPPPSTPGSNFYHQKNNLIPLQDSDGYFYKTRGDCYHYVNRGIPIQFIEGKEPIVKRPDLKSSYPVRVVNGVETPGFPSGQYVKKVSLKNPDQRPPMFSYRGIMHFPYVEDGNYFIYNTGGESSFLYFGVLGGEHETIAQVKKAYVEFLGDVRINGELQDRTKIEGDSRTQLDLGNRQMQIDPNGRLTSLYGAEHGKAGKPITTYFVPVSMVNTLNAECPIPRDQRGNLPNFLIRELRINQFYGKTRGFSHPTKPPLKVIGDELYVAKGSVITYEYSTSGPAFNNLTVAIFAPNGEVRIDSSSPKKK